MYSALLYSPCVSTEYLPMIIHPVALSICFFVPGDLYLVCLTAGLVLRSSLAADIFSTAAYHVPTSTIFGRHS